MADWFRQGSARAGEQTSLSVLLARLERQVVRARRFRLYRSLRRRPTEVLEPRLLLSSPQIKVQSQHDGQYWSIRFVNMPDGVSIGTADPDPNDSLPQDCLYYADTNGKHFDIDWGDQNRSGYFDLADMVNNPVTKPLYISALDGTDTFEFDNFNTYGRSFYVLQEHSQLNDVDDPPVVIEEHNNYLAEPNIGSKILQVSGIIDTNVKPGTQAVASAGNIGLFSNQQVTIGSANGSAQNTGLKGRDITVATWALGTLSARKPEVTVTHATIDGADVSLTAYSRDLDFKKQVFQLDFKQIAVTVEDSFVTAKGAVTISAIQDDSIGFGDGNYNYAASQVISAGKGYIPQFFGNNREWKDAWSKFFSWVNLISVGYRAGESKVSLDGATIQADGAVSVGSTANVATSLTSIQTLDLKNNVFAAFVLAGSRSTATTDVTNTTITSWNDSVSITSYASAKASSMARALAGYRPNDNANEFKSNAATKTISVAVSYTDLTSQTTVDENSKISAGTSASITSDGTVSNNSTTKSRSFNDGSLGLSISLGMDSSTVQTTVKGIVQSGISLHSATPPVIRQSLVDATAASLLPTPSDTDFLPLHVNPGESLPFQPGDWVSNLLDPNSPLPEIGPVAGASSLTAGDSYYVVDTANNQLQLALGPSLDLNLPRDDSQGQPTVIPLSTRQTLSVQVTRAADDTLDPATPNRPGPGYLYLPDHFLTTGQLVRYAHLYLPPDDLTAASPPLSIPYGHWAPSEPRNTTDEEDALGMNPDGTWQAVAGSTNRGYVLFKVDGTYTYRPDPLSFPDARVDASNNGGFVAFPTDAASNAAILAAAAGNPIWLNASDSVEEGVWDAVDTTRFFTADSTPASTPYAHWATDPAQVNDPQKDLLVMNADGTWQAVPATDGARHGYVLYKSDQTYTYVPGPFTRPDADADATRRGGFVSFPKNAADNAAIQAQAAGNTVWLNASDSAEEGLWTFWDRASLDSQIGGLTPGSNYYVIRYDNNFFQLAATATDAANNLPLALPASTQLQDNFLTWTEEVAFDPNQLDETTNRLRVDLSQVPGIQTGDKVVYHVDPTVVRYAPQPVNLVVQPTTEVLLSPTQSTTVDVSVYDAENSLWVFPNHQLQTGDVLYYHTLNDSVPLNSIDYGTNPDGEAVIIPEGQKLYVIRLDDDRLRLARTADDAASGRFLEYADIPDSPTYSFTTSPNSGGFTFNPFDNVVLPNVDLWLDTIWVDDPSGLATGQRVTYQAGPGNAPIGGLVSGTDYYLVVDGGSAVGLADSWQHAQDGVLIDLTDTGTTPGGNHTLTAWGLDPLHDWMITPGHGLQTGQPVTFQAGDGQTAGLTEGQVYYAVRLTDSQYRLMTTREGALAAGSLPASSTAPAGAVDLQPFSPQGADASVGFESGTIVQMFNPSLTAAVVNLDDNTLGAGPGWTTGMRVVYRAGGGEPIGGLTDEATYVVIALPGDQIALATSAENAAQGVRIDLTSRGSLGLTGHFLRVVPDVELAGDEQPTWMFDPTQVPPVDTAGDVLRISRHGYVAGQTVRYLACDGAALGGLESGREYVVRVVDADHFQLLGSTGDTTAIDLIDRGTGGRHGFEVPRVIALADVSVAGLVSGQEYAAVVDRGGQDGLLRLTNDWGEALDASLLHYDLSGSATGFRNVFQKTAPPQLGGAPKPGPDSKDITITSTLTASNSSYAYPSLGGDAEFWEVLSYPEYTFNAAFGGVENKSAFRSGLNSLIGENPENRFPAAQPRHDSWSVAFAIAWVDHTVTTTISTVTTTISPTISPGAKVQSRGALVIDSTIAQSGTVQTWGGVAAKRNATGKAISGGFAFLRHTNTAQTLIGDTSDSHRVILDAAGQMDLTSHVTYARGTPYKSFTKSWKVDSIGGIFAEVLNLLSSQAPAFLSSLGLGGYLNAWAQTTNTTEIGERNNNAAEFSFVISDVTSIYRVTNEVTLGNTNINQDQSYIGGTQSVRIDAQTDMTLITLAGMIGVDLHLVKMFIKGSNNREDGIKVLAQNFDAVRGSASGTGDAIGAAVNLMQRHTTTRARVLGTSKIATSAGGKLTVNAQEIGKQTVLSQSGARAGGGGEQDAVAATGSFAFVTDTVFGDDQQKGSLTVAQIDRGVSVGTQAAPAGDLEVTARNHSQTRMTTGAVSSTENGRTSVGISFGLIDLPRTTLAYLGTIPDSDVDKQHRGDSPPSTLTPGTLSVDAVTVDAQNTGSAFNLSLVGSSDGGGTERAADGIGAGGQIGDAAEPRQVFNNEPENNFIKQLVVTWEGMARPLALKLQQTLGTLGVTAPPVVEQPAAGGAPIQGANENAAGGAPIQGANENAEGDDPPVVAAADERPDRNRIPAPNAGPPANRNRYAISGDAALSFLDDQAFAVWAPADFTTPTVATETTLTAVNNTDASSLSGAFARSAKNKGGRGDGRSVSLSGSVAWNSSDLTTTARLGSPDDPPSPAKLFAGEQVTVAAYTGSQGTFPTVDKDSGAITWTPDAGDRQATFTVGSASIGWTKSANQASVNLGLSVGKNDISTTTTGEILNVDLAGLAGTAAGNVTVTAEDDSRLLAFGGVIGVTKTTSGRGVGIGSMNAVNSLQATTTAQIGNSSLDAGTISVQATCSPHLTAIAVAGEIVIGHPTFAVSGAFSANYVNRAVTAQITGDSTDTVQATGDVTVSATDSPDLFALSTGVAVALGWGASARAPQRFTATIGAAVSYNHLYSSLEGNSGQGVIASIDGPTLQIGANDLTVEANSTPTLQALAIPLGVLGEKGTVGLNVAAALAFNHLEGDVVAEVTNSDVTCHDLTVTAKEQPDVSAETWAVTASVLYSSAWAFSLVVGFNYTWNKDETETTATLGNANSQAGDRQHTVTAAGDVTVSASRGPRSSAEDHAMYRSRAVGITLNIANGNNAAWNVSYLGMFAYNTIDGGVTATLGAMELSARNLTVTATDDSTIHAKSLGLGVAFSGSAIGFTVTVGVITQVAVNFATSWVQAIVRDATLNVTQTTSLVATKTQSLEADSEAIQIAASASAGVAVSVQGVYTNIANNPDRRKHKTDPDQSGTDLQSGASAQVLRSQVTSGDISVVARATPKYKTSILQVQGNVAVAATSGWGISVGWVRSRNRLYETVKAVVQDSTLTSTTGAIDVQATLVKPADQATVVSDLTALSVTFVLGGTSALSLGGIGSNSNTTAQSTIQARIENSHLDAKTSVRIQADDQTAIDNSWTSRNINVAAGTFAFAISFALPIMTATVGNTVEATVLYDPSRASTIAPRITARQGDLLVEAVSRASIVQEVKSLEVAAAIGLGAAVTVGVFQIQNTLNGKISANVAGGTQPGSLLLSATHGTLRVQAEYAGDQAGQPALSATARDWGLAVGLGAVVIEISNITSEVSPTVEAKVTGGVQLSGDQTVEVLARTDGQVQADVKQFAANLLIGLSLTKSTVSTTVNPTVQVTAGGATDTLGPILKAPEILLRAESQLDALGQTRQSGYGLLAAVLISDTTSEVKPTVTLEIGQAARLEATSTLTLEAIAGTNRNPPPTDVQTVSAEYDTLSFGGVHSLNAGDRLKYSANGSGGIVGLVDGTVYRAYPVTETLIQLGEEFEAPLVRPNKDRLVFAEATGFRTSSTNPDDPPSLQAWNPANWDTVVYQPVAGTPVEGLTPGQKYLVNRISDDEVMLFAYDAQGQRPTPAAPHSINNSTFTTTDGAATFTISGHGFADGQLVHYVAAAPLTLGARNVNTSTTVDTTSGEEVVTVNQLTAADPLYNDHALYVGDRVTELSDGETVTYHAGDAAGNWYWTDASSGPDVSAQGKFWDTEEGSAAESVYTNWAQQEPVSSGQGALAMNQDGTWSNATETKLDYYVLETKSYLALSYTQHDFDQGTVEEWAEKEGYWLPSISSQAQLQLLREVMLDNNVEFAWLGGTDNGHPDTWTWETNPDDPDNGTTFWQGRADGEATGNFLPPWATNEPNDMGKTTSNNKEDRLLAHWDGQKLSWNDTRKSFQSATGSKDTPHPQFVIVEQKRYQLIHFPGQSPAQAASDAATKGGWLATIGSAADNAAIQKLLQAQPAPQAWLGGGIVQGIEALTDGGTYTVQRMTGDNHKNSIQLLDANKQVVPLDTPVSSFTFTLVPQHSSPIAGLVDGNSYWVKRLDANSFQLQTPDANGHLTPVVLPTPTDLQDGQGSFLGTLGIDLTKAGTGTQRLIYDLTSSQTWTAPSPAPQLVLENSKTPQPGQGTGLATAVGTSHAGAALASVAVHTTATSSAVVTLNLDQGSWLGTTPDPVTSSNLGKVTVRGTAYGNAISSSWGSAGGLLAIVRSDAELETKPQVTLNINGTVNAGQIEIDGLVGGRANGLSQGLARGVIGSGRADARVYATPVSQVNLGVDNQAMLQAQTALTVQSRVLGLVSTVQTRMVTGAVTGTCTSNWGGDDNSDVIAVNMGGGSPAAGITVAQALLEVTDPNGQLKLDAAVVGVEARARIEAQATGLLRNSAAAIVAGELNALVWLQDAARLTAPTIKLTAREEELDWEAVATVNKSAGFAESRINNTGNVRVATDPGSQVLVVQQLVVEARQLQTQTDLAGLVWGDDGSRFQTTASVKKGNQQGTSSNGDHNDTGKRATRTLDLNSSQKPIDWQGTIVGRGEAFYEIPADFVGNIPDTSPVIISRPNNSYYQIDGYRSLTGTNSTTLGYTTAAELSTRFAGATLDHLPNLPTNSQYQLSPRVTVINHSPNILRLSPLDLSQDRPDLSVTGFMVTTNDQTTSFSPMVTGATTSQLTVRNLTDHHSLQLSGDVTTSVLELVANHHIGPHPARAVTLQADRFALKAGGVLGNPLLNNPSPLITLQSWHSVGTAEVQASSGQDLSLQVRCQPNSAGEVTVPGEYQFDQARLVMLPWLDGTSEREVTYWLDLVSNASTISHRTIDVLGNMQISSETPSPQSATKVNLSVQALVSNLPDAPALQQVAATGDTTVIVASSGAGTSHVGTVASEQGSVWLSAPGDLVIDQQVRSAGTVTWTGSGALQGSPNPGTTPTVQAVTLVNAGSGSLGIDTAPLRTQISFVRGLGPDVVGGVVIDNLDRGAGLRIGDLTVLSGNLRVVNSGTLTVDGPLEVAGGGNLSLIANGVGPGYEAVVGPNPLPYAAAQNDATSRQGQLGFATSPAQSEVLAQLTAGQSLWLGGDNAAQSTTLGWATPTGTSQAFWHLPPATPFWLSLPENTVSPPPVSIWRNGSVVTGHYANWKTTEPNNWVSSLGTENHAVMEEDGSWNDTNRQNKVAYVLFRPTDGSYTLINDQTRTFADALADARTRGGYLATVTNATEQAAVKGAANGTQVWLNLTDEGHEGDWQANMPPATFTYSNWANYDGTYFIGWSNWKTGEPNNYNNVEDSAVLNGDGTWNDISGTNSYGYVLKKGSTYTYIAGAFTFNNAVTDAKARGGIVAPVLTYADQVQVRKAAGGKTVWLNLTDSATEGEWLAWDDNAKKYLVYSNWAAGEPSNSNGKENYAILATDGRWNDVNGTGTHPYVLYTPADGKYTLVSGAFTFAQAIADAATKNGYVARVTSQADNTAVKTAANGNVVWLNLTDDEVEGVWRTGTYGGQTNAAIVQADGTWSAVKSTDKYNYVLFKPADNSYTLINDQTRTFAEALADARDRLGQVARITTASEQQSVKTAAQGTRVWLALTDEASEGTWKTTGSGPIGTAYQNWSTGQPVFSSPADRLAMQANGAWQADLGTSQHAYVLYRPEDQSYTLIPGAFTFAGAQADAFQRGGWVAPVSSATQQSLVQTAANGQVVWLSGTRDANGIWRFLNNPGAVAGAHTNWGIDWGQRLLAGDTFSNSAVVLQSDGRWDLRSINAPQAGYLLQTAPASLFVQSTIKTTYGNGNINLVGQGEIRLGSTLAPALVSTEGTGQIAIGPGTGYVAGQVVNGNGQSDLKMTATSQITSEGGNIALLATGDLELAQVATGGKALLVADYNGVQGGIADQSGTILPTAGYTGTVVTADEAILSAEGVGNGAGVGTRLQPLAIDVKTVAAVTDKGDLALSNSGSLTVGSVDVQLQGLLSQVLKWKDVAPVSKLPQWLSQWFQQRQEAEPLIATANGHFVMGGAAILDQLRVGEGTSSLTIGTTGGNLTLADAVPVINLDAGRIALSAWSAGTVGGLLSLGEDSRIYTEGGTGAIELRQGNSTTPMQVPIPQATRDWYKELDLVGELSQGQQAWLHLQNAPANQVGGYLAGAAVNVTPAPVSIWQDGATVSGYFTNWNTGAPNNAVLSTGGTENHAVMLANGTWDDIHKSATRAYVLYTPVDGKYTLVNDQVRTFEAALANARARGGYLATVTNRDEQAAVQAAANGTAVWLNLSDEGHERDWQATIAPVDASYYVSHSSNGAGQVGWSNWKTSEPKNFTGSEDNAILNGDGTWSAVAATATTKYAYVLKNGSSYTYVAGPFTFDGAVADARNRGGIVAPVITSADQVQVKTAAGGKAVWLNLTDSQTEGVWLAYEVAQQQPAIYSNWASAEPDNRNGNEHYAVLNSNGRWNDMNGTGTLAYVLYTAADGSYTLVPGAFTFAQALADARNRGGTMATVTSGATQSAVQAAANGNSVWLNLTDAGHEGEWQANVLPATFAYTNWQANDGTSLAGWSHWGASQPSSLTGAEDNAVMNGDGTWSAVAATTSTKHGYVLTQGSTWTFIAGPFTFEEAVSDAKTRGGVVAPVITSADQAQVQTAAAGNPVWLNLSDAKTEGEWLAYDVAQQQPAIYSNWAPAEPSNSSGNENYAVLTATGQWNDVTGTAKYPYVLYTPADGKYTLVTTTLTFAQAIADAASRNGYVARVTSQAENTAVQTAAAGKTVWLNLTDDGVEGTWRAGGYGSQQNAAIMQTDGTWASVSSTEKSAYLLYQPQTNSYLKVYDLLTFDEALTDARERGGLVASITTAAEQARMQAAMGDTPVWLNMTDAGHEGSWSTANAPAPMLLRAMLGSAFSASVAAESVPQERFFVSTDRAARDSATANQGSAAAFSALSTDEAGRQTIFVRVFDPQGNYSDYQRTVVIEDALPTDLIAQPTLARVGQETTFTWQFTDPGEQDQHRAVIDWGDGSPVTELELPLGQRTFQATHRFAQGGAFPIRATLVDVASGTNLVSTTLQPVSGLQLVGTELRIFGSRWADTATAEPVTLRGVGRAVRVTIDWGGLAGVTQAWSTRVVKSIRFEGFAGNDRLAPASSLSIPIVALGGEGDDDLAGANANDVLDGGVGCDVLNGWGGNDQLVGGLGHDRYFFPANSRLGTDLLVEQAGEGLDWLDFSATTRHRVVLQLGTTALQTVNANLRLRLSDVATFDNVVGGQLNDRIVGNALANLILGGPGADDLSGLGDTDVLVGGTGLDTLRGGGPGALLIPDSLDLFPLGTGAFPLAGLNEILFVWSTPNESVSQRLLKLQTGFGSELSWRLTNRNMFVTQLGAEMLRG